MATVQVKFRPSSSNHKEGTLRYQLIHRRKVRSICTGYKLFPDEWSAVLGEIRVLAGTCLERQRYLTILSGRIRADLIRLQHCISHLEEQRIAYTVDHIVQLYSSCDVEPMFLDYGKVVLDQLIEIGKTRTVETYRKALNSFRHFLHDESDVPFYNIDTGLMMKYEVWLKAEGVCRNTSSFYMRNLRAIYNRAVRQGVTLQKYPFRQVYTGIGKTMKRAVSLSVIRQIRDLHLSDESVMFARDMFMFSFYTRGMSFVDMAFLKKKDLQHGFLTYRRNKTGQQLLVKWEKPMQDLIEKYPSPSSPYLLPILQNNLPNEWHQYQNFIHRANRHLKKIGWMLGLAFPLTTYVARHAWASIAQSRCISLAVISEALGHESEKTTRIYLASLDTSRVDNANSLILDLL